MVTLLALVFTVSLSYYISTQSDQNSVPSPTPTPSPLPSVEPTEPVSIIKPSVPEFTVELVDSSYDVPTTYSTDLYTGENVTHEGYHVEETSIEVRIKNQPFTSYWIIDSDGKNRSVNLYYNIWVKGHFEEDWRFIYYYSDGLPTQAPGEYTVFTLPMDYPSGGEIDFKVEAMAGYVHRPVVAPGWPTWAFTGEESWSEIQILTIP